MTAIIIHIGAVQDPHARSPAEIAATHLDLTQWSHLDLHLDHDLPRYGWFLGLVCVLSWFPTSVNILIFDH